MRADLAFEFLNITEQAALAAAPFVGQGDKKKIDAAAVKAIRETAVNLPVQGEVVVGEGEKDKAPRLEYGEKLGIKQGAGLDIAVDPIEGTEFAAQEAPNSLAVIAAAEKNSLLSVPDIYMDKIVVGPQAKGAINLQAKPAENLAAVADALDKKVTDLTVVVLNRPRHQKLIKKIRLAGANLKLISGVDIAGGIAAARKDSPVDILMGVGGAPEGILTAAAVKCLGGDMQAQLSVRSQEELDQAVSLGISDVGRVFTIDELVTGNEIIFSLTGVTTGELLAGVEQGKTHSLLLYKSKSSIWIRELTTDHFSNKKVS